MTTEPDPRTHARVLGIRGVGLESSRTNGPAGRSPIRACSVLRALLADLLNLLERLAEVRQPLFLSLGDQSDAPRERVAARAGDAGVDQRVQDLSLGHPEPRHRGDRERREKLTLVRTPCTPADLATEPAFGFVRDPHPLGAGVLAEPGDPCFGGRGPRLGAGVLRELGLGQGADDEDLVPVERNIDRPDEPLRREPTGEPTFEVFLEIALLSHGSRLHDYIHTS